MGVVLSAEEMRRTDERAIKTYGVPGIVLMENAGAGIARAVERELGTLAGKTVLIVCGKGNNGGDGFVVGRHLANAGAKVEVLLLSPPSGIKGDALTNFKILKAMARARPSLISIARQTAKSLEGRTQPDLIVDAIFGTGFSGKAPSSIVHMIEWINSQGARVFSIDIPSGVHGSTGRVEHVAVRAERTLTMAAPKIGLLCSSGRDHSGTVEVIDIGMPREILSDGKHKTFVIESEQVRRALPVRTLDAHKYSVGKVFILAGAKGYTGAAVLSALGALKAGSGAVQLGVPEAVYPIIARKLTEPVLVPLPSTSGGSVALAAKQEVFERMEWADVLVVGPGLSRGDEVLHLLQEIWARGHKRMLIDADALYLLSRLGLKALRRKDSDLILTPHAGEFSQLSGMSAREVESSRVESARTFARAQGVTVVLKGAPTATAMPDGTVILNTTGNPGLATVGSGDVLSGVIAGLWAQGCTTLDAASSGVYLHGRAGDLGAAKVGQRSLVAGDLIQFLPFTFEELER
jgi:NAD(P)H-hydrate epimerase